MIMKRILWIVCLAGILSILGGCYVSPYPYDNVAYLGVGTSLYYRPSWPNYHHHHHYKRPRYYHHGNHYHYHRYDRPRYYRRGYSRRHR